MKIYLNKYTYKLPHNYICIRLSFTFIYRIIILKQIHADNTIDLVNLNKIKYLLFNLEDYNSFSN